MSESVGARSQTRPSMSSLQMRHPRHANQLERGSLKCDNRADISDDVCGGRHSPALAEAMQGGYHRSNPHLQMGDLRQPDILLSPLQMRIPGRKGGALQASLATRLKRLSDKSGHGGFFVHLHENDARNAANCQDQRWFYYATRLSESACRGGACTALHSFGCIDYIREGRSMHSHYDARHRLMGQPLRSGVMIIRFIYIIALKCGDSEEHTP